MMDLHDARVDAENLDLENMDIGSCRLKIIELLRESDRRNEALAQIQNNFKQAVADQSVESMVYHNDQFHHHMGVMADNTYLMPSLQRLLIDHARIGQTFWQGQSEADISAMQEASAHHDQFIEVLAAGDGEAAVALTWEHWELSRQHMDRYVRPDPLPIYDEVSVAAS